VGVGEGRLVGAAVIPPVFMIWGLVKMGGEAYLDASYFPVVSSLALQIPKASTGA
jgi:hypothetical protein